VEFYQYRASPKLGLTPLIDVVFILLLFFMLASNFNRWQQMPVTARANSVSAVPSHLSAVDLRLFPDKTIQLSGGDTVTTAEPSWIADILSGNAETPFKITPAQNVSVQTLIDTVSELQAHGVTALTFGQ